MKRFTRYPRLQTKRLRENAPGNNPPLAAMRYRATLDTLPSVNDSDAKHFHRADAVTVTLSPAEVDAIRRALDATNAPANLRRRFKVN